MSKLYLFRKKMAWLRNTTWGEKVRKLASIRKIDEIRAIDGADAIECAVVGGWTVVVKKGEYRAGDLAIYCEVDSWIPHNLAPFLSKGKEPREYNGVKGERLRTVKLRGQLSQGLLLPTVGQTPLSGEGDDLTEFLGIQKWEAPIPACLAGLVKGSWPSAIPKTDQERVQNLNKEWEHLRQYTYEVTEKLEGSSMTVGMINGEFIVCSRNLSLKESDTNSFWRQARAYDIEAKMLLAGLDDVVIQGELIGEGVQGNHYGIVGQDFYVYDIYDIERGEYYSPTHRWWWCSKLGLKHVPVIEDELCLQGHDIPSVLWRADGGSLLGYRGQLREGLVFKRTDGPEHFKAVSNNYLLKHGG